MRHAEVLILDDLGTQRSSPWADEKLFQLINHCHMYRLPIVVTTNEREWLRLEERIQSRMSERRLVTTVIMDEEATDYWRGGDETET